MTPVLLIGGMTTGIFTPTEAAIAATVYAMVLGMFVYRTLSLRAFIKVSMATAETTAIILLIVAGASIGHRLLVVSLNSLIAEEWSGLTLADMLEETVVNTVAAWACFQATDSFAAAVERRLLHRQARWGRRNF